MFNQTLVRVYRILLTSISRVSTSQVDWLNHPVPSIKSKLSNVLGFPGLSRQQLFCFWFLITDFFLLAVSLLWWPYIISTAILFVFNTFIFNSFSSWHLAQKQTNKQKSKKRKPVLLSIIGIVKFSLPIRWEEASHLPVAQEGLLHYAKTSHTANSSIIYTFIVHYPNHLSPWEFQKFSYAPLIHSRYTNLDGVSKKEKKLWN